MDISIVLNVISLALMGVAVLAFAHKAELSGRIAFLLGTAVGLAADIGDGQVGWAVVMGGLTVFWGFRVFQALRQRRTAL